MEEVIKSLVNKALTELGIQAEDVTLEHPADTKNGDYSTNIALALSKRLAKNPREIAEQIVSKIEKNDDIEKVEVAGAGFINFFITRSFFTNKLIDATKEDWGANTSFSGKKILVEHSSPNLFKPFHVGHLMNNTIGESIVRLARMSGAEVVTMSFPSDISLGVAKAIFILLEEGVIVDEQTDVVVLGDAYVKGVKRFDEDESVHVRVKEIADNLYAGIPSPELSVFDICKKVNMQYFVKTTERLGSEFDTFIYESEAGVRGKELVKSNTPEVFTESEGAIVYIPEEASKLHTAVFLNSQDNPTYEAKDLGLLEMKFKKHHPDLSIFITDAQQVSHFCVVLDAGRHINPVWAEKSLHRYHGRMSFKGQKMSSRLGGVPLVTDIIEVLVSEIAEYTKDRIDASGENPESIALSAIKYSILKSQAGKDINFDPDTSLSFEGDSGPYLQYTAVRAGSLIKKGMSNGIKPAMSSSGVKGGEALERHIARFPEAVMQSQNEWTPHYLVTYLIELAQLFNSWYAQGKIIDEDVDATGERLLVVSTVRNTLVKGLWILGITVPEKM